MSGPRTGRGRHRRWRDNGWVTNCCHPGAYDKVFGPRFARLTASRYRRRGLDRTARRIVDWLTSEGIEGTSVLEIGGGVGAIQLDLLSRGAARTTNIELSQSFEADAARLNAEAGVTARVDRRIGDLALDSTLADPADVVILHRVVCCYPDIAGLLTAAADHAKHRLVFSHPPRNLATRTVSGLINGAQRLTRSPYRSFVHRPSAMLELLRSQGFHATHLYRGPIWEIVGATRG